MTEQAQESGTKKLGGQLATVGGVLIAASIVLPMMGVFGGTASNVMLAIGLVIGITGVVMSRMGKK